MSALPPIAGGHCAHGNAGAKAHFPHLACVRKVLEACLQGAVGPGSRGSLWIPIAPAILRNVPGGFRCLVPTGVGVSAFGGTDSGCQCRCSGATGKSRRPLEFFLGPAGAHVAAEGHREPSLGNWNPFVPEPNPTEKRRQKKSKEPRNPKPPKMCHANANQTGPGY